MKNGFYFASCFLSTLSLVGFIRSLSVSTIPALAIHIGAFVLFTALFIVMRDFLVKKQKEDRHRLKNGLFSALLLLFVLGLCALRFFTAAILLYIAAVAVGTGFLFTERKRVLSALLVLLLTFSGSVPYFAREVVIANRNHTATLNTFAEKGTLPHGVRAKTVYCVHQTTDELIVPEKMYLAKSMQGILSLNSEEQLYLDNDYSFPVREERLNAVEEYFPDTKVEYCEGLDSAFEQVSDKIRNYVYFDLNDYWSTAAAANLCHQLNAVMICSETLSYAEQYGWQCVQNTEGWTERTFLESDYYENVSKNYMYLLRPTDMDLFESALDYAILMGAYMVPRDATLYSVERRFSRMNRNFIVLGGFGENSELGMVTAAARFSGTYLFSNNGQNFSVMSGFQFEDASVQPTPYTPPESTSDSKGKHTVMLMLSDGDNIRYMSEQAYASDMIFQHPGRQDELALNYGVCGAMSDVNPIQQQLYFNNRKANEDFVMQISSIGYTYPTKWSDTDAWLEVVKSLDCAMQKTGIRIVEVMDDHALMGILDTPLTFGRMSDRLADITALPQVDGCLYITFMSLYNGYHGRILWSNGKPVVSARYSVWAKGGSIATEKNDLSYIARQINGASRDETNEDAYSFVIFHAWSGLNENGELVADGNPVDAMLKLIEMLDDDVEVVSATEFIGRISKNVVH